MSTVAGIKRRLESLEKRIARDKLLALQLEQSLDVSIRRPQTEPLDEATRERLNDFVMRWHERPASDAMGISRNLLRDALSGKRVRVASARAIRLALALEKSENPDLVRVWGTGPLPKMVTP